MSTVTVREAVETDAAEIARIQRVTWRTAYQGVLSEQALAELDSADTEARWAEAIAHPGSRVHLAVEGSFVVGFCVAGPAPRDDVADAHGALPADAGRTGLIGTLLVEPRWARRGHGARLLAAAAAGLRELGADRGITWAAETDAATLSFFRRAGWHPDGTVRTLDTGEGRLRELRLTGALEIPLVE
ncbi:GNAT family N-acetyltransferase [Amycolatopsis thermophila]|uniref:GNAT superfamily N-acetyltransferase n=1 Tax=Amycolatopsis thermophila TaxID=206084 RepID=A0ABU0F5Q5_9PSEU|nr:GNAT family N-acetyltransferase [Amycolatopsis thermophila]MDQ0382390.1 GNAT superfamily N-acetyltransferase [Amycolatopsis thermophila]